MERATAATDADAEKHVARAATVTSLSDVTRLATEIYSLSTKHGSLVLTNAELRATVRRLQQKIFEAGGTPPPPDDTIISGSD